MRWLLLCLAIALSLFGLAACADQPRPVLSTSGLIGEWAIDCDHYATVEKDHFVFAAPLVGQATLTVFKGPYGTDRYRIRKARLVEPALVRLEVFRVKTREHGTIEFRRVADRFQIWTSTVNNKKLIEKGRMLATGLPAVSLEACQNSRSSN